MSPYGESKGIGMSARGLMMKLPKPTSCSLKMQGRKVEKAPNLILDLKLVSPVPFRWNGTICAKNTILPRSPPLLNPRPMKEEALIQFVPDIDNNVVVCGYIDNRTWKLVVDSNDLLRNSKRRCSDVRNLELELKCWIRSGREGEKQGNAEEKEEEERCRRSH
uniref:Uncharacterized protein n=1 Tax=Lotus japonicus TaxID=34305 RepID=I3T2Z9_LOTJA|nr:unknown [Lotus japonicus]